MIYNYSKFVLNESLNVKRLIQHFCYHELTLLKDDYDINDNNTIDIKKSKALEIIGAGYPKKGNTISSNIYFNDYLDTLQSQSLLPLVINSASASLLSNIPYFTLNKGKKVKITRVSDSNILRERYSLNIEDIS